MGTRADARKRREEAEATRPANPYVTHDDWVAGTRNIREWTGGGCVSTTVLKAELERALAFCEMRDD